MTKVLSYNPNASQGQNVYLLPFHPPPPPFMQAKDVNLNGEYSMKLLFLVG
jgi:hypothetical protein